MPDDFNIDFHCHPLLRSTNTSDDLNNLNLWDRTTNYRGSSAIERWVSIQLADIAKHSQAFLNGYAQNNTKIVFEALYPIERGWTNFKSIPSLFLGDKARKNIFRISSGITEQRYNKLTKNYGYFEELKELYTLLKQSQGASPSGKFNMQIGQNFNHIQQLLKKKNTIIVIPTIEGAHSLGVGTKNTIQSSLSELKSTVSEHVASIKNWEHPPFFVGLAHHFWNQLCGHAKSFKHPINMVIDQRVGLNHGVTELGWHTVEQLLSRKNGKRILIDIKHMSLNSRIEYYQFVQRNNIVNDQDPIPIICSHTGVNGISTLKKLQQIGDKSRIPKNSHFNNWSMNLCAEEISIIYKSGGVIGIILDKAILGNDKYLQFIQSTKKGIKRKQMYLKLIWDTIFYIIETIKEKQGWNVPVFASDFDGLITQIEFYNSAENIEELKFDMLTYLISNNYKKKYWFNYEPEELIQKVFQMNTMNFLQKHYV